MSYSVGTRPDPKISCKVATTANITLSGTQTIDGVSVSADERVLVKNQTTASENGIYLCKSGSWVRATDANESPEVTSGMFVFVEQGTVNADTFWVLTTDGTITVGSTSLSFSRFAGIKEPLSQKTSSYTLTAADSIIVFKITSAATLTLPAGGSTYQGMSFVCKNRISSTADVTVDPNGSETIDGVTTKTLTPGDSIDFTWDSEEWVII